MVFVLPKVLKSSRKLFERLTFFQSSHHNRVSPIDVLGRYGRLHPRHSSLVHSLGCSKLHSYLLADYEVPAAYTHFGTHRTVHESNTPSQLAKIFCSKLAFIQVFKPLKVSKKHFKELVREGQICDLDRGDIYAVEDASPADERLSILLKGK